MLFSTWEKCISLNCGNFCRTTQIQSVFQLITRFKWYFITGRDIYARMTEVYGSLISYHIVGRCCCEFLNGCTEIGDEPHRGRLSIIKEDLINTVRTLIEENGCITVAEIQCYFRVVLGDSRKLVIVFTIDSFSKSIDSFNGIIDSFYIKNANVNVPLHPPKKKISLLSQRMILSSKKLLYEKVFETSFPIKKVIFIFVIRHPLPFPSRRTWPQKQFFAIFSENTVFFFFFLKKLLK